jgi:hypothetical protein
MYNQAVNVLFQHSALESIRNLESEQRDVVRKNTKVEGKIDATGSQIKREKIMNLWISTKLLEGIFFS